MANTAASKRTFLPRELDMGDWQHISPYFEKLSTEPINSKEDLIAWMKRSDELQNAIGEYQARLFIGITTDSSDTQASQRYNDFLSKVYPHILAKKNDLNRKLVNSPFLSALENKDFFPAFRVLKGDIKLYNAQNNQLLAEEEILKNQYNQISSGQVIEYHGKQISANEVRVLLESSDRDVRQEVYEKYAEVMRRDRDKLDALFTELLSLRVRIAANAGFDNYSDYKFAEWGRFDYTIREAEQTYKAIADVVSPLYRQILEQRKQTLGLPELKPWDSRAPLTDRPPLNPSENSADLITKSIECLTRIDPYFGQCIAKMKEMNHLDIEPRLNKISGAAYNADLPETGVPFIMQNNGNSAGDVLNLIHESGHAIHSLLTASLEYSGFKQPPLEICEVASKAMELMSMSHWDIFYPNPEDLKEAKKSKLNQILSGLIMYAHGESFQFWSYQNPTHTVAERHQKWAELDETYANTVNYSGYEDIRASLYQNNMAIYALPFYMTAYIFSDLGAIALWRNFKKDPAKTIEQYKAALSLGNKATLFELYETAGIKFEFSAAYVKELMHFIGQEVLSLS